MGRVSLKAILGGVAAGVGVAMLGLILLVAAVAAGAGIDITDARNADLARRPSIQVPFLSVWLLALLAAGTTAGRLARGRALRLHGAVIGGIALLGALAGISRQDPAWATALLLLSALPVAIAGAHVGPAPGGPGAPPVAFPARWALALTLAAFCVATLVLAASEDGGVVAWTAFGATAALLGGAVHARFRGNAPA
ncbi:MAG TPA: hypothetical protein VMQ51_17475 [Candidatus Binatia bacterium]|nr:hypothetical protein [Candidatus Binatia bacterium]